MPYSDNEHKDTTKDWYNELKPEIVVDIGAGAGTYADKFRDADDHAHWVAVEIFVPNIARFDLTNKYDEVIVSDVRYIDPIHLQSDLIIAGDVIEHLAFEHVEPVIEKLLANTKHLLISLPIIHFEQGEHEGNPFETHHYHWGYDELKDLLAKHGRVVKAERGEILGVYLVEAN